jgi:hypothetical protein
MANLEFLLLPNIVDGRPNFAISSINEHNSHCLIITSCSKFFLQKCPNAIIIERTGNNDTEIISNITDISYQVVVLDDCFYDAVDANLLLKKVQLLQTDKQFKILVFSQFASLIIHKTGIQNASKVWLPKNYTHALLNNSKHLGYYCDSTIDR